MIALYKGAAPETAVGCRINALVLCYGGQKDAALYRSDDGALICRLDESLLVCGRCDIGELLEFAEMLGICRIELDFGPEAPLPQDWKAERYPLLYRDCCGEEEIGYLDSLKGCFEIIRASDDIFAEKAQYLYWLSDITRRQNTGCGKAYRLNGAAAVLSALWGSCGYLSSVAVLPPSRKKGEGKRLLEHICSDKLLCGKRLFTAAQNEDLMPFYLKSGFSPSGEVITIWERVKLQ